MNDIKAFEIVEVKQSDFKIHFIFKLFALVRIYTWLLDLYLRID